MFNKTIKQTIKKVIPTRKVDLHDFSYTINSLVKGYENSQKAIKWHGELLSNDILTYKQSDTIFVLGSGPSINDISEIEWNYIAKHDSIGFNYWLVHDFVPKIYMFQFTKSDNLLELFKYKHNKYKEVPFIIRGSEFAKGALDINDERINLLKENPVYYLREYPISGRCSIEPNLLYRYMDALGYMQHGNITKFIPKWRTTLGLILMFAYQMGYKKIVLCGMDMYKSDHFWDYQPYSKFKNKYKLPEMGTSNISAWSDKSQSLNTVKDYIVTLKKWFYDKNKVSIFVINKKTRLYPEISLFNF